MVTRTHTWMTNSLSWRNVAVVCWLVTQLRTVHKVDLYILSISLVLVSYGFISDLSTTVIPKAKWTTTMCICILVYAHAYPGLNRISQCVGLSVLGLTESTLKQRYPVLNIVVAWSICFVDSRSEGLPSLRYFRSPGFKKQTGFRTD